MLDLKGGQEAQKKHQASGHGEMKNCYTAVGGSRGKRFAAFLFVMLLLILLDQWTKGLASAHLKNNAPVPLIPDILELLYTENTGAAFGILKGQSYFFYLTAGVVSVFACAALWKLPLSGRMRPLCLDLCFIVSGALGNVIDRFRYGYVVDFIYFKPIDFPVFNIADIYITCACAALAFLFLFYYREEELKF